MAVDERSASKLRFSGKHKGNGWRFRLLCENVVASATNYIEQNFRVFKHCVERHSKFSMTDLVKST